MSVMANKLLSLSHSPFCALPVTQATIDKFTLTHSYQGWY